MRITIARGLFGIGILTAIGCSPAHADEAEEAKGDTTSNIEETQAGDGCDPAAGQARLKATFERTSGCAIDAATAGFGKKFDLAAKALGDTKDMIKIIKSLKSALKVTDVSTARAVKCLEAVGAYAADQTTKDVLVAASVGLTDAEIDELVKATAGTFTVGVSETFTAFNEAMADSSIENLVAFLTQLASNALEIGNFVNTCGSVLAPFGTVSIPNIAKYSEFFEAAGTITSIASCGAVVIENAADVIKEWSCYSKDLAHIAEQQAQLQAANDDRCASFAAYTQNPALRPILESGGDRSEERAGACYQVMHHWGSCVYDAHRAGFLGDKKLTCAECRTVCGGYVNGAGPNAYLQPVLDGAYAQTNATKQDVQNLVMAANSCATQITADGIQPCINFCRGQVADCPAQ